MNTVKIAFFWHMHQPCYKDPLTNRYLLPWVRLHAIREYYDMICIQERFPDIRQTFNLVPSLVAQIQDYTDNTISDLFLDYSLKPASDLSPDDKNFILKNFFMAQRENMIKPYPRYWGMLNKRGAGNLTNEELYSVQTSFTPQDFLDIQVWFNLTWFGYSALKEIPELKELISKGKEFTEDEKKYVIEAQFSILRKVLPAYKKSLDSGQVELTTSPFYHLIMPLVYDTEFAKRNMPHVHLPERQQSPEDVDAHIKKGVEFHEKVFGKEPVGVWPSEGSVAPELIPILCKYGLEWMATDEEILCHSVPGKEKGDILYKPYVATHQGEKINIVFRDKGLSDLFGFTYFKNTPEQSVNDFCSHLFSIKEYIQARGGDPLVSVILDGENPWEHYHHGGEHFLSLLYERLSTEPQFETVKIGDYLKQHPPETAIDNLYTGSWIGHNFGIWIGHHEDNTGWDHIKKTRSFLKNTIKNNPKISQETIHAAWEEIYIAEGSDWFWWYGDDFSSENDLEFDRLFRSHLAKVYTLLKKDVPGDLLIPIKKVQEDHMLTHPTAFISPCIDGIETDYFEWVAAGKFYFKRHGQSMFQGKGYISEIYYGFNADTLFIRIDPIKNDDNNTFLSQEFTVHLHIFSTREYKLIFSCIPEESNKSYALHVSNDGTQYEKIATYTTLAVKNIIELSIPFTAMDITENNEVKFVIKLLKGDLEVDRHPREQLISFTAPAKNFEKLMWSAL